MKWTKVIFLGGAGALLYWVASRFSSGIGYNFKGLKWMGKGEGLRLRFALLYDLTNNNDIPATVTKLNGRIMYGDYQINELSVEKAVTIPPGGLEKMTVIFEVKPGMLLAELERFLDDRSGLKRFRLRGLMTGKIGDVPFAYPINTMLGLADE